MIYWHINKKIVYISIVNNGMRLSNERDTVKQLIGMQSINQNYADNFVFSLKLCVYIHNLLKIIYLTHQTYQINLI